MPSMKHAGYSVRFRVRKMKRRRVRNGRTRGFYESVAVYLRVRGPDGATRDLYIGNEHESATPPKRGGGKVSAGELLERELAPGRRGGGSEGWKDAGFPRLRSPRGKTTSYFR